MGYFEVFIEVDDSWTSFGIYRAETGEEAVLQARADTERLTQYYPVHHVPFVNLDYVEPT